MTDIEPPDDPTEGMPDDVRAAADILLDRFRELPDQMRQIGLYLEGEPGIAQIPTPMGPRLAVVAQWQIGKVAFSKRVQHPEDDRFDDQFAVMEVQAQDDAFLDERGRIERLLAEGKTMDEILLDGMEDDDEAPG